MNPNARILDRTLRRSSSESSGPVRVQFWDGKREHMGTTPIRIVDGVPDDVIYTFQRNGYIDSLAFVHGGKVFVHCLGSRTQVFKGQQVRLALAHLKLRDKFGHNVLG